MFEHKLCLRAHQHIRSSLRVICLKHRHLSSISKSFQLHVIPNGGVIFVDIVDKKLGRSLYYESRPFSSFFSQKKFNNGAHNGLKWRQVRTFLVLFSGLGLFSGLLVSHLIEESNGILDQKIRFNKIHCSNLLKISERKTDVNQIYSSLTQAPKKTICRVKTMLNNFEGTLETINTYLQENIMDIYFPMDTKPLLPDAADLKQCEDLPTLVVDLDKVVLKMDYNRKYGWRPILRPGAEQFFRELAYYYEIVVWSDDNYPVAQEICLRWKLPVVGVLHRDHCKRKKGQYIKDLSLLGRKLERTIIVDHDPQAFSLQPNNGILVKEFDGDPEDTELHALTDFLKNISLNSTYDLRQVLSKYEINDHSFWDNWKEQRKQQDIKIQNTRKLTKKLFNNQGPLPKL